MRSVQALVAICWLTLWVALISARSATTNLSPRFATVRPCPSLVIAARTNQIPLSGIDGPNASTNLNPGDTLSVLVTLFEKNAKQSQWLVYLQVVTPTAKESATKPPKAATMTGPSGTKHDYAPVPAWVSLRTLGPFIPLDSNRKPPKAEDKTARFILNQGFLSLGIDRSAKLLQQSETNQAAKSAINPKASHSKTNAQFSKEDERILMGMGPAMMSYVEIVQHTAGLNDILYDLVAKPSVWSVVKNIGVKADLKLPAGPILTLDPADFAIHTTNAAYALPMALILNEQPALDVTMLVTAPQPPLLSCAGVITLLAERPGDKDRFMTLRILSARHAPKTP